jgi:hypothetical protein
MRRTNRTSEEPAAFALVITVVILALLTIMAVAFLSSTTSERAISRASVNKTKSELAAKMAVNVAVARLVETLIAFPDSATSWESVNQASGTLQYQGTTIYYREQTPEATAAGTPSPLHALPLISGAQAVQIPYGAQTAAARELTLRAALSVLDATNSYDLNHSRSSTDLQGWIGSSPTWTMQVPAPTSPQPFRGQWVNQTDSDSKITSRYAYWTEDESFKANVNLMGSTPRGSNTLGDAPAQVPLQGVLQTVLASPAPTPSDYPAIASDILASRILYPGSVFFEYRGLNQVKKKDSTFDFSNLADTSKFCVSAYSGASNLSRNGSKRINLNKVVSDSIDPTAIRKQLDQIIKTITYHAPNFAQRFYRTGTDKNTLDVPDTATPSHRTIYLNKIAANIRDYIDTDSQPTIVNNDLTVNIGTAPTHSVPGGGATGTNEVVSIGKERVPVIQEYMVRVKQIEPKLRPVSTANYEIQIDHYLEIWNMTNKDISVASLGPNAFLRIANQFAWTSYGGTDIPENPSRDFSIPLNVFKTASGASLAFPAGTAVVLTTDPDPLPATFTGVDPAKVFRPPLGTPADAYRVYKGICNRKTASGHPHLDAQTRPTLSSSAADLETEIILGNATGVVESLGSPAVYYITVNADDGTTATNTERIDTTKWYFRASSLKGNATSATPSQVGDPRTNNEQLSLTTSVANDDQTAYKLEVFDATPPFDNASFTSLNTKFVKPTLWTDPAVNTADAAHAPAAIANAPLTSIGQLGDIFDPVRSVGLAPPKGSADILYSRGGGRTFQIGQPERYDATTNSGGLWDGNSSVASREWTAWRLVDVFTTSDAIQLNGRININGVNRDGGAAFKAALCGYTFQVPPDSDPQIASLLFTDDSARRLVGEMQDRLKNDATRYGGAFANTAGPFMENGELSEMPMLNSNPANPAPPPATDDLSTGATTSTAYDRGREELFRRLAELITTRGNIFTVYAVGQSLNPQSTGTPIVTSTSQLKVTFRIDPVWNAGTPADPFDPTSNARFSKPDHYAIKILYAGE